MLLKDSSKNDALFLKMIDLSRHVVTWEHELYREITFHTDLPHFYTFVSDVRRHTARGAKWPTCGPCGIDLHGGHLFCVPERGDSVCGHYIQENGRRVWAPSGTRRAPRAHIRAAVFTARM